MWPGGFTVGAKLTNRRHGHRRGRPEQLREALVWVPFACVLVPVVLVWNGSGWRTALLAGGLLAALAAVCLVILTVTGAWHPRPRRKDSGGRHHADP